MDISISNETLLPSGSLELYVGSLEAMVHRVAGFRFRSFDDLSSGIGSTLVSGRDHTVEQTRQSDCPIVEFSARPTTAIKERAPAVLSKLQRGEIEAQVIAEFSVKLSKVLLVHDDRRLSAFGTTLEEYFAEDWREMSKSGVLTKGQRITEACFEINKSLMNSGRPDACIQGFLIRSEKTRSEPKLVLFRRHVAIGIEVVLGPKGVRELSMSEFGTEFADLEQRLNRGDAT